jgi:phage shock protein A
MIARTEAVQDLQRRLRDVEEQRDQLRRQLSDVVGRAGRMETEFAAMESRFVELQRKIEAALGRAPEAPGAAAPPAAATADPPAE